LPAIWLLEQVMDIGINVPADKFVEAAEEEKPKVKVVCSDVN